MTPAWLLRGGCLCALACLVSTLLAWFAIRYARKRGMLDMPGHRRSHDIPTPRGGGIGMVVAAGLGMPLALLWMPQALAPWVCLLLALSALAVAGIGWVDDHHHIGALPRLVVQVLAATAFGAMLLVSSRQAWWWLPLAVLACTWSINLHNFMDGIDAILGLQTLFSGLALGALAWLSGEPAVAMAGFVLAAAAAGFLIFNWPPARIFMGDVGSGFAGFVIFALIMLLVVRHPSVLWSTLLLVSAFALDAGWTLVWRMWRGKRWYNAHREHLYQWLTRQGWSHGRVALMYLFWNLCLAAPLAVLAWIRPEWSLCLCLGLYVAGSMTWWRARAACLRRVRIKGRQHVA